MILWDILKFLLILGLIVSSLLYAATHISYKTFEYNTCKVCASTIHNEGLCAGRPIQQGESIGVVTTLLSPIEFRDSELGKYMNHLSEKNNIDFYPLFYEQRIDIYGYANREIDENEELTGDYTSTYAPKPNFIDTGNNSKLFEDVT